LACDQAELEESSGRLGDGVGRLPEQPDLVILEIAHPFGFGPRFLHPERGIIVDDVLILGPGEDALDEGQQPVG
jgi:hypothetical protein